MNKKSRGLLLATLLGLTSYHELLSLSRYLYPLQRALESSFLRGSLKKTRLTYSRPFGRGSSLVGDIESIVLNIPSDTSSKEELAQEVVRFFDAALNGEQVEWKPFVKRALPLLESIPEYAALYRDLKSVENPNGISLYKKYCIQVALKDHQPVLTELLGRNESLSTTEWAKIGSMLSV